MDSQLEIPAETYRHPGDRYAEQLAEFEKCHHREKQNIFFCYNGTTKQYFISRMFSRETIESYKTIKIIK